MNTQKHSELNFEKVWLMFQETSEQLKRTEKILSEKFQDTDKKFQDTDKKFQDTEKLLSEKFQDTDKKIKELSGLFSGQWGKLVEALLTPGCLALFQRIGLDLTQTFAYIEAKKDGKQMEIDVLLVNGKELVVIEVKTTSRVSHIKKLLKDLEEFKYFFPQYKEYKVYGAIAALRYIAESDKKAIKNGVYVIRSSGEGLVKIDVPVAFKAKCF